MINKKSLVANVVFQLSIVLSQLITIPVYINEWGYSYYGGWVASIALLTLSAYSDFGFLSVIANIINSLGFKKSTKTHSKYFLSGILISVISFLLISIPLNFLVYLIFSDFYVAALYIYSFYWLFFSLSIYVANCSRSNDDYYIYLLINSLYKVIELILIIYALVSGFGLYVICVIFFLISILNFSHSFYLYCVRNSIDFKVSFVVKRLLKNFYSRSFKAFLIPSTLAMWLQGCVVILSKITTNEMVVFFTTIRTLSRLLVQAVNVLNSLFWGRYSQFYKKGDVVSYTKLLKFHSNAIYSCVVIFLFFVLVIGEYLYALWIGEGILDLSVFYTVIIMSVFSALWTGLALPYLATNRHGKFSLHYLSLTTIALFYLFVNGSVDSYFVVILLVEFLMLSFIIFLRKEERKVSN